MMITTALAWVNVVPARRCECRADLTDIPLQVGGTDAELPAKAALGIYRAHVLMIPSHERDAADDPLGETYYAQISTPDWERELPRML